MSIFEMSHATKKRLHLNPGLEEKPKSWRERYREQHRVGTTDTCPSCGGGKTKGTVHTPEECQRIKRFNEGSPFYKR